MPSFEHGRTDHSCTLGQLLYTSMGVPFVKSLNVAEYTGIQSTDTGGNGTSTNIICTSMR